MSSMMLNRSELTDALIEYCGEERVGNESLFSFVEREVLEELMSRGMSQASIATLLRLSPRVVNYKLQQYSLRPVDKHA